MGVLFYICRALTGTLLNVQKGCGGQKAAFSVRNPITQAFHLTCRWNVKLTCNEIRMSLKQNFSACLLRAGLYRDAFSSELGSYGSCSCAALALL